MSEMDAFFKANEASKARAARILLDNAKLALYPKLVEALRIAVRPGPCSCPYDSGPLVCCEVAFIDDILAKAEAIERAE